MTSTRWLRISCRTGAVALAIEAGLIVLFGASYRASRRETVTPA